MNHTLNRITPKVNFTVDLIIKYFVSYLPLLMMIAIIFAFNAIYPSFNSLHHLTDHLYFNSSLLGSVFICIFYYQSPKKIYHICCYALFFLCIIYYLQKFDMFVLPAILLSLWLAVIHQLLIDKSKNSKSILACCVFLPIAIYLSVFLLSLTKFDHKTVDWLLYSVDATFGGHLNFLVGRYFYYSPSWLQNFTGFIYMTIPLAWSILVCIKLSNHQTPPQQMFTEYLLLGLAGALLYHIIPAYGPRYALQPWWPLHIPATPLVPFVMDYYGQLPRNCMPSLHTAWSYCIWQQSRTCGFTIRILTTVWLGVILFSLFSLGEHYFVDVIMGFILAVLVRGLCATSAPKLHSARFTTIVSATALMCMWYALILFGLPLLRVSILIPWILLLLTLYIASRTDHNLSIIQQQNFEKTSTQKIT